MDIFGDELASDTWNQFVCDVVQARLLLAGQSQSNRRDKGKMIAMDYVESIEWAISEPLRLFCEEAEKSDDVSSSSSSFWDHGRVAKALWTHIRRNKLEAPDRAIRLDGALRKVYGDEGATEITKRELLLRVWERHLSKAE